ncbi:NADPH-dependent FMN reductase [Streptomyces sp. NPDC014734]|uniref:NADPH-dependent FMN reductase n=1 Tax=Streptomyces sp. NPDC014734 TaxID=3364886 RepID=UPI0036F964A5
MTEDSFNGRLRIAVVIGSLRRPRLADPLAAWLERELTAISWLDLDMFDLASVSLPMHEMRPGGAAASPIAGRLADADGFVLLTPEYNHSFPAPLKNAIDWHFTEWAYKPVVFVGYGGSGGMPRRLPACGNSVPRTLRRDASVGTRPSARRCPHTRRRPDPSRSGGTPRAGRARRPRRSHVAAAPQHAARHAGAPPHARTRLSRAGGPR